MNTPENARVDFANTLRAYAALLVLVQHYGFGFWNYRAVVADFVRGPALPDSVTPPHYLSWLWSIQPFELGQFGVGLFFLISGFVLPFSFHKLNWKGFAISRLMRIYPTYAAGLVCTILGIWASSRYFSNNGFPFEFWRVATHFFPGLFDYTLIPSIDGIVWTLNIEMKFYLICMFLIPLFRRGSLKVFIVPLALSGIAWFAIGPIKAAGGAIAGRGVVTWLACFFIDFMFVGVVFHYWMRRVITLRQGLIVIALLLAAMLLVWSKSLPIKLEYAGSYAAALAVFAFAYWRRGSTLFKSRAITDYFADISYPLYVVHGVLGFAMIRIALDAGWPTKYALAGAALVAILLATAIHKLVEMPTHSLGRAWARSVGR